MSFEILKTHAAIGWDLDGTLIGHDKSRAMREFILATPEKRHVLITFRSHGLVPEIWPDLNRVGLTIDHFAASIHMTDEMYESEYMSQRPIASGGRVGLIIPTQRYLEWKGEVCRDHGCTVLVDDNESNTLSGCRKHGIVYINPDNL